MEVSMDELLGYCKECGSAVYKSDSIPGYEGIYECEKCGYPSVKGDLWDEVPDYLRKENKI
jgi:DNA-directed RNA polymerase subunit M/transcription elongation factor TFIIS